MKDRFEKLNQLALQSASRAGRGLQQAQNRAQDLSKKLSQAVGEDAISKVSAAGALAVATGKSVQQSLNGVIEHETTQALMEQVKEKSLFLADGAAQGAKLIGDHVVDGVKSIDDKLEVHHLEIKEKTESVSMGLGIAAGVAAGAAIIGPPLVVAAAPVIGVAATVSGAMAGTAYFYSKWKTKKGEQETNKAAENDTTGIGTQSPQSDSDS